MKSKRKNLVYLCVWSGETAVAQEMVRRQFPGASIEEISSHKLRTDGAFKKVRLFRGLRGQAVIFYFKNVADFKHVQALICLHLLHQCRETVLCDGGGEWQSWRSAALLLAAPNGLFRLARDFKSLALWWCYLRFLLIRNRRTPIPAGARRPDVAYLIPTAEGLGAHGGAISHIRGFLHALNGLGKTCRVFTGTPLAQDSFRNEVVARSRQPYFFWEAAMLRYNFEFAEGVMKNLDLERPGALYQRHCRFAVGGVLLARRLQAPLVLEFNGPQGWIADHWDPTPFKRLVHLCEEVCLRSATRIVVVSDALRAELLQRGIAADRIKLNPNGVDAELFCPGRKRLSGRMELGAKQDEVLVGFVGSFSFWHGVEVLQRAILSLLSEELPCRLRFVLIGDGLLREEMRSALKEHEQDGSVLFTGPQPAEKVVEYLDASDVLVSPHVPMPDGSRFFGSPTKLFEYMAMGKGIVASRLEQIAEVLEHEQTALLVTPGDARELADGILRLALDPSLRAVLGATARRTVTERYTWAHNVATALDDIPVKTVPLETVTL